ncbi:CLAVATA3/ESR (CLE)-related protein 46-like [Alnus glutinosa]|uniref:CLAVATA3/ESR (CLE)-related protein 46-like n=1 Tax=Alnus glutinosa TaxID=3517 RepID=UPI002D77B320|nr:CLAVATA3/ESR (CLE)-related protein 46-like [Alnus glutinosa]
MKRKEIQIYIFLAFILIASQCCYSTAMRNIHTAESVGFFKLKPSQARESSAAGYMSAPWINKSGMKDQKAAHKVPSGPSPIGNRHPPISRRG